MKILAIDTTAGVATAALCEDKKVLGCVCENNGLTHSETMLPIIENLLKDTGVNVDDIDMFACSTGPGSFTGVRIGVSIIKGLAFGKNKPCVGVSALEALAYNVKDKEDVLVAAVMDARRNQLYNALFEFKNGECTRLCEDRIGDAGELAAELNGTGRNVAVVGDGIKIIDAYEIGKRIPVQEDMILQNGASVAFAALDKYEKSSVSERSEYTDLKLMPVYLRPSQAERTQKEKENS